MTHGPGGDGPPPGAGRPAEPSDEQVRAAFEAIVAGLTANEPAGSAPERTVQPADPASDVETSDPAPAPERPSATPERTTSTAGWRVHEVPDPPEEHFTPPPPRPLPRDDPGFWLSLVGLVGGPCWLFYLLLADPFGSRVWRWLAGAVFVAGLVTLLVRATRDPRDPDDDGARV